MASGPPPLQREIDELSAIHDSFRALTSSLELPDILRAVLGRITAFTAAEALSLLLHDRERDELVFAATEMLRENLLAGPAEGPAGEAATGAAQRCGSVLSEDRRALGVPLLRAGDVLGAIGLHAHWAGPPFHAADRERLERTALALAAAIDPEALAHDEAALRAVFGRIAAAVPSQVASLLLYDHRGRTLAFGASRALEPGTIDGLRLRCDQGIAGWVARHREAVRLDDASRDPRHYPGVAARTGLTPRTMLCVPIVKKDALLGVIQVINKLDGTSFTADELRLVQTLADHAAIAIENASLYREAQLAAITDDLTGLFNTRHFNRTLPALLAGGGPVSLLVLDLDHFKALVDREGHLIGSRTIGFVGGLIAGHIRPGDLAARFGGDEFVVVLPATDTPAAREIAEAIRRAVAEARVLEGTAVDVSAVTASVGIATYPEHARTAEDLFRAADAAMYAVKRGSRNAVAVARALAGQPDAASG